MTEIKNLYETIREEIGQRNIKNIEIPEYITDNLKHNFFEWQKSALQYFLAYNKKENGFFKSPTHLMFNMATGTGKTLLMAATILYAYKQGYRHFLFFVNQNNIIDKTENNFIDSTHNKYLFTEKIIIDGKTIPIEKVNTFTDEPQGIEIKFTSIQKLYNDIHTEKENQTTLTDLQSKNIVMLADEAHHLNANTKQNKSELDLKTELTQRTNKNEVERKGWEHTVIELILNKNACIERSRNVLLEFTATIPANEHVAKKYADKIIYKFGLKEFLQAGYTKEINLVSSTLAKKERVLQALVFQWYRHKIALKNNIANFKPVILFRSKTIEESKRDTAEFLNWMENLESTDFDFLKATHDKIFEAKKAQLSEMGKSRTQALLEFIEIEEISFSEITNWIKQSYSEKNTIITNSKTNTTKKEKTTEETEKLLNSLENKNNHIRAIFTVDRLTEGWDVLNLFDIVRLYEGQNAGGKTKKTPEATTKEKQLIGRGVRYFPFSFENKQNNKRKFDDDLDNEQRILEELFYYTYDEESRYISHLKQELKKDGYIRDDREMKTFDLKPTFKESSFYQKTKIWYNQQEDNPNRKKQSLEAIEKDFSFEYKVQSFELSESQNVLDENREQEQKVTKLKQQTICKPFEKIEKHIFLKAVNMKAQENPLFQFNNLKKELAIESIDELQTKFLADFELKIIAHTSYENISNKEKLQAVLLFLDKVFTKLKEHIHPKIGGEFKAGEFKKFFGKPKTKSIENFNKDAEKEVTKNNWYVLDGFVGTDEEKNLIEFIKNSIGNLEEKYSEIYLLRNEEVYKIYDFKDGQGFAPDFLLFLKSKEKHKIKLGMGAIQKEMYYQIFIEPKGEHLLVYDKWKEDFLKQITKKYGLENVIKAENPNYRLIGLPFYNKKKEKSFNKSFNNLSTEL